MEKLLRSLVMVRITLDDQLQGSWRGRCNRKALFFVRHLSLPEIVRSAQYLRL